MFKPKIAEVCAQYSVNLAISRHLPRKSLTLSRLVDENIGVYENVGAGWKIFDQLRRHVQRCSISAS